MVLRDNTPCSSTTGQQQSGQACGFPYDENVISRWQSIPFDDEPTRNIHILWVLYKFFAGLSRRGEREYVDVAIAREHIHTGNTFAFVVKWNELRARRALNSSRKFLLPRPPPPAPRPIYLVRGNTSLENSIRRRSQIWKPSRCWHATRRTFAIGLPLTIYKGKKLQTRTDLKTTCLRTYGYATRVNSRRFKIQTFRSVKSDRLPCVALNWNRISTRGYYVPVSRLYLQRR